MAIFSNFITTRAAFPDNEISTGNLFISASSITSSAAEGRDELVSNAGSSTNYRLSAFTTIDTRLPLVVPYSSTPFGMTTNWGATQTAWNLNTATTDPSSAPIYWPPMLTIKGDTDSQGVYPFRSNQATFAPNVALLVSGGLHVNNSIRGFNRLEGITHIPSNNGLVIGGKVTPQVYNWMISGFDPIFQNSIFNPSDQGSGGDPAWYTGYLFGNKLNNNLTILGGGMTSIGTASGQSYPYAGQLGGYRFAYTPEAGTGLQFWGATAFKRYTARPGVPDPYPSGYVYGARFAFENLYGDTDGSLNGRSFSLRIANPHSSVNGSYANRESIAPTTAQQSILQYSFWRNLLILGTYEVNDIPPSNFFSGGGFLGKTQLVNGAQVEILSTLQIGQYQPEPSTAIGTILYAGFKHRFAGSNRSTDPKSQVYFDNVQLYATSSVFDNFGTDYQYALTVRSGSGLYAGNPNVWQIGLGIVSGSGGGGASLFPGGNNYDIQYNVTQGGASPRFGGANEINQTFEYVYDATPDPLFRFNGRMQGGNPGNQANGIGSMAFGYANIATAAYSIALGANTTTTGLYALAVGVQNTADGTSSFAQGSYTTAAGDYSHAEGYYTIALASYSHTEGYQTTASGDYTHAEGYETLASGTGAHAEGYRTIASGLYSHAEGLQNRAIGGASHAEGYLTTASNGYSHAEGVGTITLADYQHAEGSYNIPSSTALWVLGDGTSAAARHNLIEGHTGQVRFSGSLFVQPGQGYLPSAVQSTVLTYNPSTGQIELMNTSSFSSGGGGVSGPQYWIQDGTRLYTSGGFQNIQITGSLYASGSGHDLIGTTRVSGGLFIQPSFVPQVTYTTAQNNPLILAYNTTTGQVQRTTLAAVGAAAAPPSWSIQFNRNGNFGGTQFFIYSESLNTVFAATQFNIGLRNRVDQNTYGVVMGSQSFAQGVGSFAQGFQVTASGNYSHAQGSASLASGNYSHAEGQQTRASGIYSHAEGLFTTASGIYSHAEGSGSVATARFSHAEGVNTRASSTGSHAEGQFTTASGNYSHAEGSGSVASGRYSHAEGYLTAATDDYTHAEGQETRAIGNASHAEGVLTLANAIGAHAEGREVTASGAYSHAEGFKTKALYEYAHAEGGATIASGSYAHAEGNETEALADGAHAEGWETKATGRYSHAEGRQNLASGLASTARGRQSTASGDYSQASGYQLTALAPYQQVFGQYNVPVTDTGSLFILGAGFSGQDKNALVVTTASIIFSSSLYFSDGTDYLSGQPFLPRASQSLMFVYDQATGQVELMNTSSLPKDGYWIQNGPTLFTSGGFSTVSVTGSLFLSASTSPLGNVTTVPKTSTVPGPHTIVGGVFISSSNIDAPALYIYQANTSARGLHVEGGVPIFISSSTNNDTTHQIIGTTAFTDGIKGPGAIPLSIVSASTYSGMRSDLVTKTTATVLQATTGSNNTIHIAPEVDLISTMRFPVRPLYGTTFTLIVDGQGTTGIETGSRQGAQDPIYRIQSPSSTAFAGAVYANSFSPAPIGVYNYMYLNVSSGSIGNAWVLTSKM
jgi:hypothetical protein